MTATNKTREQLIEEIERLRARVAALEGTEASHKQIVAALQESEENFKELVEESPLAIQVFEMDGMLRSVNRAWETMWDVNREQMVGTYNALEDDQLVKLGIMPFVERAFAGESVEMPETMFDPGESNLPGSKRWVQAHLYHMKGPDGQPKRVVLMAEDITERKQAEHALARRARELSLLHQARSALARELDLEEVIRAVVDGIAETFGYALVSLYLVEDDVLKLQHQVGYAEGIREISIEEGIVGRVFRSGEPILLKDVSTDHDFLMAIEGVVSEVCVPLFSRDSIVGILNVESTEEQPLSEADLQLMVALSEHVSVAIERAQHFTEAIDRATRFQLITDVARRTTSILDLDELLDQAVNLIVDQFEYYSSTLHLIEGGEIVLRAASLEAAQPMIGEFRLPIGDGSIVGTVAKSGELLLVPDVRQEPSFLYLDVAKDTKSQLAAPIKLKDIVIGVLNIEGDAVNAFTDADLSTVQIVADQLAIAIENAHLYDTIRRYAQELEHRVAERTSELETANQHLEQLSRVKDEFVSNVSHELRTPISNLKLYHDLLQTKPEKAETYLVTLRQETERLAHIVESLLTLSGLDQPGPDFSPSRVDLNQLVASYVADRRRLAETQGLTIALEQQPNLPSVRVDEGLLGQTLSILLTNALNYTPTGGQLVVSTREKQVDGNRWVGFSVGDTGPGIPLEEQPYLFERFYRGKVGRASGKPGTGLGLAIAKEIVDRHHGHIEVESEGVPGKGATFTVWLPMAE